MLVVPYIQRAGFRLLVGIVLVGLCELTSGQAAGGGVQSQSSANTAQPAQPTSAVLPLTLAHCAAGSTGTVEQIY